jgi:hypothetical protein
MTEDDPKLFHPCEAVSKSYDVHAANPAVPGKYGKAEADEMVRLARKGAALLSDPQRPTWTGLKPVREADLLAPHAPWWRRWWRSLAPAVAMVLP